MPKLRLIKDDPRLQDIIPFPSGLGGRIGARVSGQYGAVPGRMAEGSAQDLEHELLGTIDRMQGQLDELSDMLGPIPLFPRDDRPTAA